MADKSMHEAKAASIEGMAQQIKKILTNADVTFGVAKAVIQKVEAELLEDGDTFLSKSELKNVLPPRD